MLTELVRRWVAHNRHTHTERTQEQYQRIIWRFVNNYTPKTVNGLTREHIENFLQHEVFDKGLTNATANTKLATIKSFFRWLEETYDLPNPARKIKMFKALHKQRILSEIEYQKALAVCTDFERDLLEFLSHTGLRSSEMRSFVYGNSTMADDLSYISIIGKGGKPRLCPLNVTAKSILLKYLSPNRTINLPKSIRHRNTLIYMCHRIAERAQIPVFSPHALRHRFATQMMLKNVSLPKIAKCLGHASTRVTEAVYIHFTSIRDIAHCTDVLDK